MDWIFEDNKIKRERELQINQMKIRDMNTVFVSGGKDKRGLRQDKSTKQKMENKFV